MDVLAQGAVKLFGVEAMKQCDSSKRTVELDRSAAHDASRRMFKSLASFLNQLTASPVKLHASKLCTACGSRLAQDIAGDTPESAWTCPNPDCPPEVLKRAIHWASPTAMDIQGCDAELISQMVNKGLVRDAADFYRLKVAEIAALDGMNDESAKAVFASITASVKRDVWRVLYGLNIPNIGAAEAKVLCNHFASLEDLFAADRDGLAKLEGITGGLANSITSWFSDPVNRKLIRRLEKSGVKLCA